MARRLAARDARFIDDLVTVRSDERTGVAGSSFTAARARAAIDACYLDDMSTPVTPTSQQVQQAATTLRAAVAHAADGLVDREGLVELMALAAVAGEHVLVIGPPGTAKSEAVRRLTSSLSGRSFEYLLGRFTEPAEIFGPVDLRRLREGVVEVATAGMLPEAEVAFLDEVFLGSTAILNTLLGILNERRFKKGTTTMTCPLRVCVGASNALPTEPSLQAFADRFLLRSFVDSVSDPLLEDLLAGGRRASAHVNQPIADFAVVDVLAAAARGADVSGVRGALAHAVRALRSAGVQLSDRRIVKLQGLVAAAAVVDGRATPDARDLWPIVFAVPTLVEQQLARDVLKDVLARTDSSVLPAAAVDATAARDVKARLLIERGTAVLQEVVATGGDALSSTLSLSSWRLRLEGVAREIDAGFAAPLPEALAALRAQIVSTLSSSS